MAEPGTRETSPADAHAGAPDSSRTATADPFVRGFLFADLRGYTAFVERAGDQAAADLLSRYRLLVRSVVASHDGAEIRTEGDSFYVVFPSPSAAVRAGLAIVAAAAEDEGDHPTDPISVGVGVHAGESTETTEGYVGSAVNQAARICSVARPGEVLVSDTVRILSRTRLAVTFTSRGRKVMKGVAEPVELWAVRPTDGALSPVAGSRGVSSRGARAGLIALGAGVVVVAVVGIAALSGYPTGAASPSGSLGTSGGTASGGGASSSGLGAGPSASVASVSGGAAAFHTGPLEPGTYHTEKFTPGLSLTVPEGWTGLLDETNVLMLGLQDDPVRALYDGVPAGEFGGRLTIMRPTVAAPPCTPRVRNDGEPRPSGSISVEIPNGRDGFRSWARSDPTFVLGSPVSTRLGAFDTVGYEVAFSDACDLSAAEVFRLSERTNSIVRWSMLRQSRTWWYVWEHDGQTLLLALDAPEQFPQFEAAARSVLTSLAPAD